MENDNPVSHDKSLHLNSAICCHDRIIFTAPLTEPKPVLQTLAKKKFIPRAMSHANLQQRIDEKKIKILTFLADGEVYTTMKIASHLLRLGVRQTQHTLSCMVRDKLLKFEDLEDGTRIYGMTGLGREFLNSDLPFKVLQIGKTNIKTVPHHLLSQWVRIEMGLYGAENWVAGKMLFGSKFFRNVPDSVFTYRNKTIAVENEVTLKYGDPFKTVLQNYCDDFGEMDDLSAILHQVIYFTPHFDKVREGIKKFVPIELQSRFFVVRLDLKITPFKSNEGRFLDDDLQNFLIRNK
jgi:hypothetical protein